MAHPTKHFKFRDMELAVTYGDGYHCYVSYRPIGCPPNTTYRHLEDENFVRAIKLYFDSEFDMSFQDFLTKLGF